MVAITSASHAFSVVKRKNAPFSPPTFPLFASALCRQYPVSLTAVFILYVYSSSHETLTVAHVSKPPNPVFDLHPLPASHLYRPTKLFQPCWRPSSSLPSPLWLLLPLLPLRSLSRLRLDGLAIPLFRLHGEHLRAFCVLSWGRVRQTTAVNFFLADEILLRRLCLGHLAKMIPSAFRPA